MAWKHESQSHWNGYIPVVRDGVALGTPAGVEHRAGCGSQVTARYRCLAAHERALAMPTCAFLSFRLGETDGVSIVAHEWMEAFRPFGFDVRSVAGEGPVDRRVPGLAIGATAAPELGELEDALDGADLVDCREPAHDPDEPTGLDGCG